MARNGLISRRRRSPEKASTTTDEFVQFSPSVSHDIHVLAVDDSLVDRKVIERLLKITSCKVTAVESGWRALQYLGLDKEKNSADSVDETKVDLIITDYCMPGMTGYELLKKIKGSATFREVPVVIMSSENVLTRIDRCMEEGAEDFIVKPVKLSDVKRIKDYMFGDENQRILSNIENNRLENGLNKRKLQDISTPSSNSPNPSTPSISSSAPQSPPQMDKSTLLSIYPTPSTSPPLSSSQLHSPTTRLKVTNFGQA